jgi:radical SAM-linked protein
LAHFIARPLAAKSTLYLHLFAARIPQPWIFWLPTRGEIQGMPPESLPSSANVVPSAPSPATRVKLRVRFSKVGDLRFVSHHDLMHIFERTFRRADLPVPATQGFNPRPRMWFALSLALGIPGLNEVLELELSEPLNAEVVRERLARQTPPGIEIRSVRAIDVRASARVLRAWYRIAACEIASTTPQAAVDLFLSQSACWIERARPQRKRINLRPFVSELHVRNNGVHMALWISPQGAARPEEIIAALGLACLLEDGAVIERTDLEIIDELPPDAPQRLPALAAALEETRASDPGPPAEEVPSARPTALMDDPMSFDS